jgi:phosphinothricin acetyltransferase
VELHTKFGFRKVGQLRQVGFKFSRWLDVVYMELILDPPNKEIQS